MRIAAAFIFSLALALPASAQCVADLESDLVSMGWVVDGIVAKIEAESEDQGEGDEVEADSDDDGMIPVRAAKDAVGDLTTFAAGVSKGGALAASCLIARHDQFRRAALDFLGDDDASLSQDSLRTVLHRATAATLSDRYQSNDRFSVFFAIGFLRAVNDQERKELEKYKIVSRGSPEMEGGMAESSDTSFIVRESASRGVSSAMTGVLFRFREREPREKWCKRLWQWIYPTAVFASAQLSTGDLGVVNGASLGLGWNIVGGAHLLFGYSVGRTRSLRGDLRMDFDAQDNKRLPLPAGETEESIKGTATTNFLTIAVGFPVSFRSSLGG